MRRLPIRDTLKAIAAYPGEDVDLLAQLVVAIRPGKKDRAAKRAPGLTELISLLEADPVYCVGLALYVERLVKGRRFNRVLIDQGMPRAAADHLPAVGCEVADVGELGMANSRKAH